MSGVGIRFIDEDGNSQIGTPVDVQISDKEILMVLETKNGDVVIKKPDGWTIEDGKWVHERTGISCRLRGQ